MLLDRDCLNTYSISKRSHPGLSEIVVLPRAPRAPRAPKVGLNEDSGTKAEHMERQAHQQGNISSTYGQVNT